MATCYTSSDGAVLNKEPGGSPSIDRVPESAFLFLRTTDLYLATAKCQAVRHMNGAVTAEIGWSTSRSHDGRYVQRVAANVERIRGAISVRLTDSRPSKS